MTMKQSFVKLLLGICLIFNGLHCGSAATPTSDDSDTGQDESISSSVNNNSLNFLLNIQINADEDSFNIDYAKPLELPLAIDDDGNITIAANAVPKIVYRICTEDSTTSACDARSDLTGGFDLDLVIDACGRFVANENCGTSDNTTFNGKITQTGTIALSQLSIRVRVFAISNTSNGFTATTDQQGLLDLNRLLLSLTTNDAASGLLSVSGMAVDQDNWEVILVGAGKLPSSNEALGGADFAVTILGAFANNPF